MDKHGKTLKVRLRTDSWLSWNQNQMNQSKLEPNTCGRHKAAFLKASNKTGRNNKLVVL